MKYSVHNFEPSEAENRIMDILNELEIEFLKDVKYENLGLYFDFLLPEYNILIEYNGKQHYTPYNDYHKGDIDAFKLQQDRDKAKVAFCAKRNIPLLILKAKDYYHLRSNIMKFINNNRDIPAFRIKEVRSTVYDHKTDLSFFGIEN